MNSGKNLVLCLFPQEDTFDDVTIYDEESKLSCNPFPPTALQEGASRKSSNIVTSGLPRAHVTTSANTGGSDSNSRMYSFSFIGGSNKESHEWDKM